MPEQLSSLEQLLITLLGQPLSKSDLSTCLGQLRTSTPTAGQQFWQSSTAEPGIYLITAGKVRLLDQADNLLASIEAGMSFGETTLFPEHNFQICRARASTGLELCYFPLGLLQALIQRYPCIRDRLFDRAIQQDLLLLLRRVPSLQKANLNGLANVISLMEQQQLEVGSLSASLLTRKKLWLLRCGELLHDSGIRLTVGNIFTASDLATSSDWQVTQPSELYSLDEASWPLALQYVPDLNSFSLSCETALVPVAAPRVDRPTRYSNVITFPQQTQKLPQKPQPTIGKAYFPKPHIRVGHWLQRATKRYPWFEQQSASDCAAACLVMVARYWGKQFSVNHLRDLANVDRHGASLKGLAAAAESIGFATRPVKASLDKLAQQNLPAIAHWEGKHYIVVYEVTRNHVIVGDPAIGQRTLSRAEFELGWTHYVLLLQPTVFLEAAQDKSQPLWQFFELARPHWLVLLEVFCASFLIQVFGLVTPLLTQLIFDRVVVQRSTLTLTAIGLGLAIFGLFRVAMTGLRQYLLDHTANKIDLALIIGFIRHAFRLPLSFFESRYVGDIIARVQENHKLQRFLAGEALSISLDLLTVFVYIGLMLWYNWKLALLVLLLVVPLFMLLALIATPLLRQISRRIFAALANESSYLIEAFTGVRTIKAMAVEKTVRWHWEELLSKFIKANFSGQVMVNQLQICSSAIETTATTALLWFGAWLVIQNELTIGQLVAFNMLLANVIHPFQRLTVLWHELQEVLVAIERINDVIDAKPEEDLRLQQRQSLPPLKGLIQFEQVTFRYHPESDINILENLSFTVQPGQTVALVGRSGSGKTTVSKLILGLYPATTGRVLIDGYDITRISLQSLRHQVGVVDQDTFLFGSTIRENISLGHPEASLEEVIAAAQQAGADEFIKQLPLGYETKVGEGGGLLSGGQRQRLAIARALLGNPRLLIFDEATSHLDTESERIIHTQLSHFCQNRTTVIIAHRLSTVRQADLILVLDKGILVESGSPQDLMAKRGHYYYLSQQQLAGIS